MNDALGFAVCVQAADESGLTVGRAYVALRDEDAQSEGMVRIVDDSGEDYLHRASWFALFEVPDPDARRLTLSVSGR